MTLTKKTLPTKSRYDWTLLAEAAVQNPGEWICEDDEDRPATNGHQIRRGTPAAFDPPGAFDAVRRADGTYVRYLGVPIRPWVFWEDDRDFASIERTIDPERFPEGTPARFVELASLHTPRKAIKRERAARGG